MTMRRSTEAGLHSANGQGSRSISSSSGVDADPRTRFMIDFNFNSLAALAVRANNR
jgi:hypothetical protein